MLSPSALPVNTWSHLAMTYNGSMMRLFVNGVQVASVPRTGNAVVSAGVLKIGGNAVWGEWFAGLIDEVRIFNRALTAGELQAVMNTAVTPSAPAGQSQAAPATEVAEPASQAAEAVTTSDPTPATETPVPDVLAEPPAVTPATEVPAESPADTPATDDTTTSEPVPDTAADLAVGLPGP